RLVYHGHGALHSAGCRRRRSLCGRAITLPRPRGDMNALARQIIRLILMQGPLSVAQYMAIALHDPAHGYYSARQHIGAIGDFITAPEIRQLFGELLGSWIVQAWRDQGSPSPARLVELGPGRGTLMAAVL